MQHAPTHVEVKHIVAQLTAVFEDAQRYRQLLRCRGAQAQQLLDLFQILLDNDTYWINSMFRRNLVAAAQRLANSAKCLPTCYNLGQVELLEDDSVASGSFADIYKARFRDLPVCMKVMRIFVKSDIDIFFKAFAAEAILWGQLSHPNLLPFYGLYTFKQRPCLVSPWMDNHDINHFLKHHPDANRLLLVLDIARGVAYLHTRDIIHGDLKGANVLVDGAGRARVADFGLSSVSGADILHWTTHSAVGSKGGSIRWQAPELFDTENDEAVHNSKPTDVYAFSSTSYEVLTGNFPFHEINRDANVILKVQRGAQPSRPPDTSQCWTSWGLTEFIWSLMEACWNQNPQQRPSIHEIVMRLTPKTPTDVRPSTVEGDFSALQFRRSLEGEPDVLSASGLEALLDKIILLKGNTTDSNTRDQSEAQLLGRSNEMDTRFTSGIQAPDLISELLEDSPNQRRELEESTLTQTQQALVIEPTPLTPRISDLPAPADEKNPKKKNRRRRKANTSTAKDEGVHEVVGVEAVNVLHTEQVSISGQTVRSRHTQDLASIRAPIPTTAGLIETFDVVSHPDSIQSPEIVDRKITALLDELTMKRFNSISDQIIAWADKSKKEKDGRTLIQIIGLIFEKVKDEITWSETYALLSRKMMERISPEVQADGIKNSKGKPLTGGHLFRKYLLDWCQKDFERGWALKEAMAAAAAARSMEDQTAKNQAEDTSDVMLYSDEYKTARRQRLRLIKFFVELFKLEVVTERVMHESVKRLLGNIENPEEEEIESLCELLSTVGSILDTRKARAHMDVYFSRTKELTKSPNVSLRMQFMLQDVIELRERRWVSRNLVAAPTTFAQVHEAAVAEKEVYQHPDGWAVAGGNGPTRPPPKAGDLSILNKILVTSEKKFGSSIVFNSKKDSKRESLSRTGSSSNMFSILSCAESTAEPKASEPLRKRLALLPRTKATTEDPEVSAPKSESEDEEEDASVADMTEKQANDRIAENLKELMAIRNLDEAEFYFTNLPAVYHSKLVEKLTSQAIESKDADVQLIAQLFSRVAVKEMCSANAFEEGFMPLSEAMDDIAIDAPKAFHHFATIVKSAELHKERIRRLAAKSLDGEQLLAHLL